MFAVSGAAAATAVATAVALILAPITTASAADVRVPKIAVLMSHDAPPYQAALKGFREFLEQSGVHAHYDVYNLRGDPAESDRVVQGIKRNGARLVYTLGAYATEAAIHAEIDAPLTACLTRRG